VGKRWCGCYPWTTSAAVLFLFLFLFFISRSAEGGVVAIGGQQRRQF
jgi:hypothetical protein